MDRTTYYGRPALKPAPFEWKTSVYILLGGVSGAAAVLGLVADLTGGRDSRKLVRNARYLTLPGITAGPALLVAALHTPARFYNMFRIFRATSPMSIGSYTLGGFAATAGITAAATAAAEAGLPGRTAWARVAQLTQVPAALLGSLMAVYTGALLASTSNPLWSAAPRLVSARFGSAAMAAASAVLAVAERRGGRARTAARLEDLAALAAAAELAIGHAADRVYRHKNVAGPLETGRWAMPYRLGVTVAGAALPVVLLAGNTLLPRRSAGVAGTASLGIAAGSLMLRLAFLYAGNASAERPLDYFAVTQPLRKDASAP